MYSTFSRQQVRGVLSLGSTSARRQLPNTNRVLNHRFNCNPIFKVCIRCHLEICKIRVSENFITGKLIVQSFLAGPCGFALVGLDCNFCQRLFGHMCSRWKFLLTVLLPLLAALATSPSLGMGAWQLLRDSSLLLLQQAS